MKDNQKIKASKIDFFLYNINKRTKKVKILLHKRDDNTKSSPNKWDCFGGEVNKRETPKEAFTRELYEELGIWVRKNKVRLLRNICNENNYCVFCVAFSVGKTKEIRLGEGAGLLGFLLRMLLNLQILLPKLVKI